MKPPRRVSPPPAVDELLERIPNSCTPDPLPSTWLFRQEKPHLARSGGATAIGDRCPAYSSFAIGLDRSDWLFGGFLSKKTTPRDLYHATVIAKLL
jgi:hypothetical protein